MKLKYKVRQIKVGEDVGKWAAFINKNQYLISTVSATKADAEYESLLREGWDLVEKLDDVQERLESTGRINSRDPHAWRS